MQRVSVEAVGSVSRLVFGCASVGGRVSERASLRAMAEAFEAGVTTFDVARSYGYGDAERILGGFVRERRERVQIITKAGIRSVRQSRLLGAAKSAARAAFAVAPWARRVARSALGTQQQGGNFEPDEIEASLVESLHALRTDHVDALLLHGCDAETACRDDLRVIMQTFVKRGLVKRVGVASSAQAAAAWIEHGGEPTAELPAIELTELPSRDVVGAFWLANQPLGGGALFARLASQCEVRGIDRKVALSFLLRRPLSQGAHAVVVSMLSGDHARHAIDCLRGPEVTPEVRAQLEELLKVQL